MARVKIREYDAKGLLLEKLGFPSYKGVLITPETNLESLSAWTRNEKLTVKPDQLFGKRGKLGLVLLNADFQQVKEYLKQHLNKEITIGKATGTLTHFLIEPYVKHELEYYLCITSERDHDLIHFSEQGGVNVEEKWDAIVKIAIPTLTDFSSINFEQISDPAARSFIQQLYRIFVENHFTYLELNPFTFDKEGKVVILDTVAHVDSCASTLPAPKPFGRKAYPEEEFIGNLDRNSGASLKLTVLNPNGKIWNILGGGGASIIYLDMIANVGKGNEIANYGESSGNPSADECYQYAASILKLMTEHNGKILFIVGGIANFTDVRETFTGFIRALEKYGQLLKKNNVTVFVRRGGPHDEEGLKLIAQACTQLELQHYVHGPETSMPQIIRIAKESL